MSAELKERLDRVADRAGFAPSDAQQAIRAGTRVRRRRTTAVAAGAVAAVIALGFASTSLLDDAAPPSPEFGSPGDRRPAVAPGGSQDAYADLVVSVRGNTITGFGWPLAGQGQVSSPAGDVSFPEIDKVDAETMCLPMLRTAAPDVPATAWHHSEGWVDGFPTRAGLITSFEAEHAGRTRYASCVLPGDHVPDRRPDLTDVPSLDEGAQILEQCGYLAHIDLSAWDTAAVDAHDGTVAAALVAPDGTFARCALSSEPARRLVQVSAREADGAILPAAARGQVVLVGRVPDEVVRLTVRLPGDAVEVPVVDGTYAAVLGARPTSVTAYDAAGEVVPLDLPVVDAVCFTPIETGDDGC